MTKVFVTSGLLMLLLTIVTCKPYGGDVLEESSSVEDDMIGATILLEKYGDLKIKLPSALIPDKVSTAKLEFVPGDEGDSRNSSFILGTADADNVTSSSEGSRIANIHIEILLSDDTNLCPDGPFIVELAPPEEITDDIVFGQTDVFCKGNPFAKINKLTMKTAELTTGTPFVFYTDKEQYGEIYNEARDFIKQETKEDGFLEKYKDKDLTKKFLLHYKMLDAYHQTRQALKFPDGDERIEGGWTDRLYDFINLRPSKKDNQEIPHGIVIPSLLNGFLNPAVNRISLDDQINSDEDLATRVSKQALETAVAKFLHYQYVFEDNDIFENAKFERDFGNINWHSDLRKFVDDIINKVNDGHKIIDERSDTREISKLNINEINATLSQKLTYLSSFMSERKRNGESCQKALADYYYQFSTPLEDETVAGDALVLLNSRHIMHKTGIHEPCKNYGEIFKSTDRDAIKKAVVDGKQSTLNYIKKLNNKFADRQKSDFLVNLVKDNYNALVPVLTADTTQIVKVVEALRESERKAIKERRNDRFWAGTLGFLGGALAAIGIVTAISLFLLVPFFPPIAALGSAVLWISLAGGAILTPMHGWNFWQERGQYHKLERQIFSGANADTSEAARSYNQWRKAKFAAITEGIFTGVGVGGGGIKFVANPRAGFEAATSMSAKAGGFWKSLKKARQIKLSSGGGKSGTERIRGGASKTISWARGVPKGLKALGSRISGDVKEFRKIKDNYTETWRWFREWAELRKLKKAGASVEEFVVHPNHIKVTSIKKDGNIIDNKVIREKLKELMKARNKIKANGRDDWKFGSLDNTITIY